MFAKTTRKDFNRADKKHRQGFIPVGVFAYPNFSLKKVGQRFVGDPSEIRTPDTMIKSHVLYHLS